MDAASSGTLAPYHIITRCHNAENQDLDLDRRENVKSDVSSVCVYEIMESPA